MLNDNPLMQGYQEILPVLKAMSLDGFDEIRSQGAQKFLNEGLPTRHDEEFRFVSFGELSAISFQPAYGATVCREDLTEASVVGNFPAYTIGFINGQYAPEISSDEALPDGLVILPFEEAADHAELIKRHLCRVANLDGKLGSSNDERFVHLNEAHLGEGVLVLVKSGVKLDRPIHILYVSKANFGPFASHPRNLIVIEENARAEVLESYVGIEGISFCNGVTEVVVAKNGELVHVRLQDETEESFHLTNVSVEQEESSRYLSYNVNFGAHLARNEFNVNLKGENCETRLDGVSVGLTNQVVANHTRIDHALPNCNSFEVYKTVLGDEAKGVFNGKIFVYEDAQKTDAKQTNQTLLLSRTASIDTKPQLEIFADDVKCTHGATVGQIGDEAMFYLMSRGIPKEKAKAILVYAFAAEVLERIPDDGLRERLESRLFAKLMPGEEA